MPSFIRFNYVASYILLGNNRITPLVSKIGYVLPILLHLLMRFIKYQSISQCQMGISPLTGFLHKATITNPNKFWH